MRNNKGFGKLEVIILLLLFIIVFAGGAYMILGGANNQKFTTMKENGWSFSKIVATNISSFHYPNVVYLGETYDEGLLHKVKNPFGSGYCDESESRIDTEDGKPYVTFKCGKYLIDHTTYDDAEDVHFYEVSEWSETKPEGKDVEERTLYNCADGDELLSDKYHEELYFVYLYNKEYGTNAFFAADVNQCEVLSKTFYRTHKLVQ